MEHRFFKLLLCSVSKTEAILLYGFSSDTDQPLSPWRDSPGPLPQLRTTSAILSLEEGERLETALPLEESLSLGKYILSSPSLIPRSPVLSIEHEFPVTRPAEGVQSLTEYWNVDKRALFQRVCDALGGAGKALYRNVQTMVSWVKSQSGVDLLKNGAVFGNFHHYEAVPGSGLFSAEHQKDSDLKCLVISRTKPYPHPVLVNCTAEHREAQVLNEVRVLAADAESVSFTAQEPMSHVSLQFWDMDSGRLLDSMMYTMMLGRTFFLHLGGPVHQVSDPWTQSLLRAASNRSDVIHNQLEHISHTTSDRPRVVCHPCLTDIDQALDEGQELFRPYRTPAARGVFLPNLQKDGEIQSFLKLRSYLEEESVCRVLLADPYFSAPSAAKLLTRVPRSDLQIDILTCRNRADPDTGKPVDSDALCRAFLQQNASSLHPNLSVHSLDRKKHAAFHDRYLIRYHKDLHIDGFMLGNSINSMGEFYPFVISPLEPEVCLEVCGYLDELYSPSRKDKRGPVIRCELLWDSKTHTGSDAPPYPSPSPLQDWLACWMQQEGNPDSIPKEDFSDILTHIQARGQSDPHTALRVLSEMAYSLRSFSPHEIANAMMRIAGMPEWFCQAALELAPGLEQGRSHDRRGTDSQEYLLWGLLEGRVRPSRGGLHLFYERCGMVSYPDAVWMSGLYTLLWTLSPRTAVELLNKTHSPLLLDGILQNMLFAGCSKLGYQAILAADCLWVHLLATDALFSAFTENTLTCAQLLEKLRPLPHPERAIHCAYLIGRAVFRQRTLSRQGLDASDTVQLSDGLLPLLAQSLPVCGGERQELALDWLYSPDSCVQSALYYALAGLISDEPLHHSVLERGIKAVRNMLVQDRAFDQTDQAIDLYLDGAEALWGPDCEGSILRELFDPAAMEAASEPNLEHYNFDRWNKASHRAIWQLRLLQRCAQRFPGSVKAPALLAHWETRLPMTEDSL